MTARHGAVTYLAVLLCSSFALAVGANVLAGHRASPPFELEPPPGPVYMTAEKAEYNYSTKADMVFRLAPATTIVGSALPGVVTHVALKPGAAITNAQELYRVNNLPVRALVNGAVLYRPIGTGMSGDDVTAVQRFLRAAGHQGVTETGKVDGPTMAAIRRYSKQMNGAGRFDPTWVVRVPTGFVPASVPLKPGAAAPTAGDAIAESAAEAVEPRLRGDIEGPDGEWLFMSQGSKVSLQRAAGAFTVTDPHQALQVAKFGKADGSELVVAGQVRMATPVKAVSVPASAIVVTDQRLCLVVDGAPVLVTVAGSSPTGSALVTQGVSEGQQVLANPDQSAVSCPSN